MGSFSKVGDVSKWFGKAQKCDYCGWFRRVATVEPKQCRECSLNHRLCQVCERRFLDEKQIENGDLLACPDTWKTLERLGQIEAPGKEPFSDLVFIPSRCDYCYTKIPRDRNERTIRNYSCEVCSGDHASCERCLSRPWPGQSKRTLAGFSESPIDDTVRLTVCPSEWTAAAGMPLPPKEDESVEKRTGGVDFSKLLRKPRRKKGP